jgi:hypothetical protein
MRTRAYRPEAPACLEDRSLLSGVAGPSADPVVLPLRRYDLVVEQLRLSFQLFARDIETNHLLDEIHDVAVIIPFGRVDGLGVTIKSIVRRMEDDLHAKVPHAVRTAFLDVIAATHAEVVARVRSGDVVVR